MTSTHRSYATDDAGIPAPSHEFSATVGTDGPLVLQDHYLIEQMANFNRERIPERQPHAKGSGAFARFEVTQDVTAYTKAAVFQPGEVTEGIIRFSTVAGERGSPDTWRDPRGFAVKGKSRVHLGEVVMAADLHGAVAGVGDHQGDRGAALVQGDRAFGGNDLSGDHLRPP